MILEEYPTSRNEGQLKVIWSLSHYHSFDQFHLADNMEIS